MKTFMRFKAFFWFGAVILPLYRFVSCSISVSLRRTIKSWLQYTVYFHLKYGSIYSFSSSMCETFLIFTDAYSESTPILLRMREQVKSYMFSRYSCILAALLSCSTADRGSVASGDMSSSSPIASRSKRLDMSFGFSGSLSLTSSTFFSSSCQPSSPSFFSSSSFSFSFFLASSLAFLIAAIRPNTSFF